MWKRARNTRFHESESMTTEARQPIKSGWPSFDVAPPKPQPHWSYDPTADRRQRKVNQNLSRAFEKAVNELWLRQLAMVD